MAKVFTITPGLENLGAMKTGGQGSVYKGRRIGEIITAIKILPTPIYSETTDDKNFISFQNEVQKLKKVNEKPNPNVVKILSSGITESGNLPFIEMEFIEGPDLEELLEAPNDPIFSVKEIIKIADQLSHALAHCHNVDVMHGDIKSNNIKLNLNTGIYVLLDFGLAVMSDEQRRTSLRHAGAIEFMAPEQSEGQMLPQSDIYSFGVIMFELVAGRVPFQLKGKSESARNQVAVAHLETLPPDILQLRQQAIPESWGSEKKQVEMEVPEWLVSMIYKCLEKKPENRFKNGDELHDYIWNNSIRSVNISDFANGRISELEQENTRLRIERDELQQQLLEDYHKNKIAVPGPENKDSKEKTAISEKGSFRLKHFTKKGLFAGIGIILISLIVLIYVLFKGDKDPEQVNQNNFGNYRVVSPRAYFYNQAAENSKRNDYAIPDEEPVTAIDDKGDFIYAEIANENGQKLKGWLRKQDLESITDTLGETNKGNFKKLQPEVIAQLQTAKQFFNSGKTVEALIIYNTLAREEVPEAMYYYGKLALQNKNDNITCAEAFEFLKKASNNNYLPAKRTLGFIYTFADDKEMLDKANYYNRCTFTRNLNKGSKLLMEAVLNGDTAASRLLDTVIVRQQIQ